MLYPRRFPQMTHREQQLYTKVMGEIQGPFTSVQLKQLAQSGKLSPTAYLRTHGVYLKLDPIQLVKLRFKVFI